MKKAIIILIAILLILFYLSPFLMAQSLDAILAKNYEVRGGLDKLKAVKSMTCTGKMVLRKTVDCPFTLWRLHPDKTKMEIDMMGKDLVQAYNGKMLWWINPFSGDMTPTKMEKSDEDEFFETIRPLCMDTLIRYKDAGHTLEYAGKEKMEGTQVVKLKLTVRKNKTIHFYLDGETGVELKIVARIDKGDHFTEYAYSLGDYQEVEGLMFPFSMDYAVTNSDANKTIHMSMVINSIKLNPELKNGIFDMKKNKDKKEELK